jgi:hypothetical protein
MGGSLFPLLIVRLPKATAVNADRWVTSGAVATWWRLPTKRSTRNRVSCLEPVDFIGGARRNRTADLFNAIEALSQLSYDPEPLEILRIRISLKST